MLSGFKPNNFTAPSSQGIELSVDLRSCIVAAAINMGIIPFSVLRK
jgi:hypothetical protein